MLGLGPTLSRGPSVGGFVCAPVPGGAGVDVGVGDASSVSFRDTAEGSATGLPHLPSLMIERPSRGPWWDLVGLPCSEPLVPLVALPSSLRLRG